MESKPSCRRRQPTRDWCSLAAATRRGPIGRPALAKVAIDGPICRIEIYEPWSPALDGLAQFERLEVLYWLHHSRRDLVRQSPRSDGRTRGTFSLRSPVRPNPIGTHSRPAHRHRGRLPRGARPRLHRRHATDRPQARSRAVSTARAEPGWRRPESVMPNDRHLPAQHLSATDEIIPTSTWRRPSLW